MKPSPKTIERLLKKFEALRIACEVEAALPPPPTARQVVFAAAAVGLRGETLNFDNRDSQANIGTSGRNADTSTMTAKPPSLAKLAEIYGCSRQRLHTLGKLYGRPVLTDPDALAIAIDCHERQPIFKALADTAERQRIKSQISQLQS